MADDGQLALSMSNLNGSIQHYNASFQILPWLDTTFRYSRVGPLNSFRGYYDRSIGFIDAWLGRLVQIYKERQTMAVAKAKGYVFKGREEIPTPQGKKIQLRFAVR